MTRNDEVRVIVVDDQEDAAQSLAILLQLNQYTVATAHTGESAVVLIEEFHPHAVILDVSMPGIDGYELATLLRHRYKDRIVLIAVTGRNKQEPRVSDTFAIVDHYFQKPVDPAALRKVLPPLRIPGQTKQQT